MSRDKDPRVKRLLEFGETIDPIELVPVLEDEASQIIKEDPFAFALAAVLDRGTKAEIIWTIPYYLKKILGRLDPEYFANASIKELRELFERLPYRPRYINDAPKTVKELSEMILREFNGDVEAIWRNKSAAEVKRTFQRIYGVGPGISSMIVLLLERWFGVKFDDVDHTKMDVKPDVHIRRVFYRLGFIKERTREAALNAARRLNPEFPGALDAPAWKMGREWCTEYNPRCHSCPMNAVCPKIIN